MATTHTNRAGMWMFGGDRSPGIDRLRELHVALGHAVAEAYGWGDMRLDRGHHMTTQGVRLTMREAAQAEVLDRLLELNQARYAEEVAAGLHERGRRKVKAGGGQMAMFGDEGEAGKVG